MTTESRVRSPGFCRRCQKSYEYDPHVCETLPSKTISQDEWMRRLRARFIERAGEGADEVADATTYEEWREGFEDDPEGAADEEMSYWEAP